MSASAGIALYLNGQNNDLGYEKEVKDNGLVEHKHYVSAGGLVFAMQVTRTGNTATGGVSGSAKPVQSLTYMHHDHLGSVSVLTDDTGSVVERLAYDPWGKRRFPNGTADTADSIVGLTLDRGFTMHEHLDEMGVIHMNGRIYDPLIGRFMSADPFIQAPENLQSHNRFAYVMNNPLSYTDPSGYFSLKKLLKAVVGILIVWKLPALLGKIGFSAPAWMTPAMAHGVNVVAAGFLAGAVTSGDLKGALQGALSAGLFHLAGLTGTGANEAERAASAGRYIAHAAAGCVTSVAGGGKCGSGTTNWMNREFGETLSFGRGVAATVAGGIGSVIAGGKFENGATTAAFGYLFNQATSAGARQAAIGATGTGQTSNAEAVNALAVAVDKFFANVADGLSYIFKSDSVTLARNMAQESGIAREAGQHAHHIVAAKAALAQPARDVLASVGMDINSAFNGIFLDPSQHARIHTNIYYEAVNDALRGATTYASVATRLTAIRVGIETGVFPR
jgi:RHS repeat-associated protein